MKKIINVALVDDHQLFREGILAVLKTFGNVNTVFEAINGRDLLDKLKIVVPDIILLDLEMPEMNGFEITPILRKEYPSCKILILSFHNERGLATKLIQNGANGFLNKNSNNDTLLLAMESICENGSYLDRNLL